MGCCSCLCKCLFELLLILLNIPLLLVSIAFIFFGIMGTWFFSTLVSWFSGMSWISTDAMNTINSFLLYVTPYVQGVSIFLLVAGIILLIITFFGGCGALCRSQCMMVIYAILVGVMAASAVTASIIFLVNSEILLGPMQTETLNLIATNFDDPDNPNRAGNYSGIEPITASIIAMFRLMPCCGVSNYSDFQRSGKWNRYYTYTTTSNVSRAQVPVMCCKNITAVAGSGTFKYFLPSDSTCLAAPTTSNSYINTPCFTYMTAGTASVFAWVIFGIALALLVIFALAVLLACMFSKNKSHGHESHEMY